MAETSTIEITDEQKAQLDDRKQHERESYKSVIGRLLSDTPDDTNTDRVADEIQLLREEIDMMMHEPVAEYQDNYRRAGKTWK